MKCGGEAHESEYHLILACHYGPTDHRLYAGHAGHPHCHTPDHRTPLPAPTPTATPPLPTPSPPASSFDLARQAFDQGDVTRALEHLTTGTEALLTDAEPDRPLGDQSGLQDRITRALQRALPSRVANAELAEHLVRTVPADLDGDGRQDLLVALKHPGDGYVLLFRPTDAGWQGFVAPVGNPGAPLDLDANSPRVVASGDLNGDGQPDVALAHRRSPGSAIVEVLA